MLFLCYCCVIVKLYRNSSAKIQNISNIRKKINVFAMRAARFRPLGTPKTRPVDPSPTLSSRGGAGGAAARVGGARGVERPRARRPASRACAGGKSGAARAGARAEGGAAACGGCVGGWGHVTNVKIEAANPLPDLPP